MDRNISCSQREGKIGDWQPSRGEAKWPAAGGSKRQAAAHKVHACGRCMQPPPQRRADLGCSVPQPLCCSCGRPGARTGLQQEQDLAWGPGTPAAATAIRCDSTAASAHLTMSGSCNAQCDIKHIATTCNGLKVEQQHGGRWEAHLPALQQRRTG